MPNPDDAPAILIIADTCSILDIARHVDRPRLPASETAAAKALHNASLAHPMAVSFAVCDVILKEFNDHISGVVQNARGVVADLVKRMTLADRLAVDLGIGPALTDPKWHADIVSEAEALARAVIEIAHVEPSTTTDRDNAHDRSIAPRPPASQGKPEFYDCVVTECAIRMAASRPLRSTFLLSSNADDYGSAAKHLHSDLVTEFAAVGLEFAFTWTELKRRLTADPHNLTV